MKRKLLILFVTTTLLFSLTGCSSGTANVGVDNKENLSSTQIGRNALIKMDGGLYYDSTTRIVYWWNGTMSYGSNYATTPSPYLATNGLPYRYNPETNMFEEIIK